MGKLIPSELKPLQCVLETVNDKTKWKRRRNRPQKPQRFYKVQQFINKYIRISCA